MQLIYIKTYTKGTIYIALRQTSCLRKMYLANLRNESMGLWSKDPYKMELLPKTYHKIYTTN